MKKLLFMLLLSTALLLTACGASNTAGNDITSNDSASDDTTNNDTTNNDSAAKDDTEIKQDDNANEPKEENEDASELDDIGDIAVEENLFDVELTIPATYMEGQTQEDLNIISEASGYKSITLNADGSATYVMTKEQHKIMMDEMADSINSSLNEMFDYPSFTEIKANDTFTEFTITTTSTELDMTESLSVMLFYMYGGMYNIFNGTEANNISVTFVNADTGEIISVSNSSDMNE